MIIGHRGVASEAPENTLIGFTRAFEQQADGIEADFRLSRDGHVVCIHDADLDRVADDDTVVADATLAELKAIDVGEWYAPQFAGQHIPTLDEVLAIIPADKYLFAELKVGVEIVEPVRAAVERCGFDAGRLVIIAFDEAVIAECRRVMPNVIAHWLIDFDPPTNDVQHVLDVVHRCGASGLGVAGDSSMFTAEFAAGLAAGGVKQFHAWSVNDVDTADHFLDLGAWALTSDVPGRMREWLSG